MTRRFRRLLWMAALCCSPAPTLAQSALPLKWVYNPIGTVQALNVSRDGQFLAVGGFNGAQIYRRSSGQLLVCIPQTAYGVVTTVAISPDDSMVALGMFMDNNRGGNNTQQPVYGGIVEIHSLANGKLIKKLPTSATFATDTVAFSPDGRTLVSGGRSYDSTTRVSSGALELWDLNSGYRRKALNTTLSGILTICFSKDGNRLAAGGYSATAGGLELWDLKANTVIGNYPTSATLGVESVAISPDGKSIVVGGHAAGTAQQPIEVGILEVWNVVSGKLVSSLPSATSHIMSIAISSDGKLLADVGQAPLGIYKGIAELWSLPSGSAIGTLDTSSIGIIAACFSPDSRDVLLGCAMGRIETWKASSLTLSSTLHTDVFQSCLSLKFSPDGNTLGIGGRSTGQSIALLNANTGKVDRTLATPTNSVPSISFSPAGKTVAGCGGLSNSLTGFVEIWECATGKVLESFPTTATDLLATEFSPDGMMIADVGYTTSGGVVELWNVSTKALIRSFSTIAQGNQSVGFSPDGKLMATGGHVLDPMTHLESGIVEVWNVSTGKLVESFASSALGVVKLSFSPDGNFILAGGIHQPSSGGFTAVLEVWNVAKGTLVTSLNLTPHAQYLYSVCFSKDGKTIFVGTDLDLEAFSASTFKQKATYSVGGVNALAISPSGTFMAVNSLYGWLGVCFSPVIR